MNIEKSTRSVFPPRPRRAEEGLEVHRLLERCGLPADGLEATEGWVIEGSEGLLGHVALERSSDGAVLRSLAVVPEARSLGLGRVLFDLAEAQAGPGPKVLRTDTIAPWVLRRGYRQARLGELPEGIRATTQFAGGLCASTPVYVKEG